MEVADHTIGSLFPLRVYLEHLQLLRGVHGLSIVLVDG